MALTFTKHTPSNLDGSGDVFVGTFETAQDLYELPCVAAWTKKPKFKEFVLYRLGLANIRLLAKMQNGTSWVIGYIGGKESLVRNWNGVGKAVEPDFLRIRKHVQTGLVPEAEFRTLEELMKVSFVYSWVEKDTFQKAELVDRKTEHPTLLIHLMDGSKLIAGDISGNLSLLEAFPDWWTNRNITNEAKPETIVEGRKGEADKQK